MIDRLIEGIGRDSRDPRIRIDLPENRSLGLRLRQSGAVDGVPWSMAELTLWARR